MKIAIFNHPFYDFYTSPNRLNPSILQHIANIIKPYKTVCYDVVNQKSRIVPLPEKIKYLRNYVVGDISEYSFFRSYHQYGAVDNFDHDSLKNLDPKIVIISSFAFCYFNGFNEMVNYIRSLLKDVIIIVGGGGPSSYPEYYIENSDINYVVVGPAELTIKELIKILNEKKEIVLDNVYGKYIKRKININKNYGFEPHLNVLYNRQIKVQLQVTRGCPKNCSYCSIKLTSGKKYMRSDVDAIISNIKRCNIDKSKDILFDFEDDNISYDKDYFIKIISEIKKLYPRSSFRAENGIDLLTLDKEYINELNENDFDQWNLSITSINDNILEISGRNYTLRDFNIKLDHILDTKIFTIIYYICGLPGDKIKNIFETLKYLSSKEIVIGISNFYPVPGTEVIKDVNKKITPELSKGTSFYQWGNLTTKELVTFFIISRFINFIKSIKIDEWSESINIKNKRSLSVNGVLRSINDKVIYAIKKENDMIKYRQYDLDSNILDMFFNGLNNDIIIRTTSSYNIDKEFWKEKCKYMFR